MRLSKYNWQRGDFFEIKYMSRENIVNEYDKLQKCWQLSKNKGYLNYTYVSEDLKDLDHKINEGEREMDKNKYNLQADLKSVDEVARSFDEIIKLFYDIQKHKREKKRVNSSQFGNKSKFDVSSTVSTIKKDFFVSKVDMGAVQFCKELSGVIDAFFGEYLLTNVGIIPLIDAFIEFNKHRGTDIVSSKEFKEACSLLSNYNSR